MKQLLRFRLESITSAPVGKIWLIGMKFRQKLFQEITQFFVHRTLIEVLKLNMCTHLSTNIIRYEVSEREAHKSMMNIL